MSSGAKPNRRSRSARRPAATTALAEPVVSESSSFASFSTFSPSGKSFGHVTLSVDKHRLRVYDTESGKALSETAFQNSRVSAVKWVSLHLGGEDSSESATAGEEDNAQSRKRKKRKSASGSGLPGVMEEMIAVGFSNGSLAIFSPRQGEIVKTLSSPTNTSAILAIDASSTPESTGSSLELWASTASGLLLSFDASTGKLLRTWQHPNSTPSPFTSIALLPSSKSKTAGPYVLAAHHKIQLVGTSAAATAEPTKARSYATVTGHASPISSLQWEPENSSSSSGAGRRFVSAAEGDRFACVWALPDDLEAELGEDADADDDEDEALEGSLVASVPLDTEVRLVSFSSLSASPSILALSSSGTLRIFATPSKSSSAKKVGPATDVGGTTISASKGGPAILSAAFEADRLGSVRVARLVGGVRPVFDRVNYLNKDSSYLAEVKLKAPPSELPTDTNDQVLPTSRYKEPNSLTIRSGHEQTATTTTAGAASDPLQDGQLDASLAELSLGQRLAATSSAPTLSTNTNGNGNGADKDSGTGAPNFILKADAPTLTRTLTQALHSSDIPLLESVLANSSPSLIAHTVRRLQPQYAVPLVLACVERMNRGARAGRGKGRGGGASAQRGEVMIKWVRATLAAHTGYLMTIPDLAARLSALHTTLSQRLSIQDRLLSLNGRLDLILAQIEFRSSVPAAPAAVTSASSAKRRKTKERKRAEAVKYVEGQSSEEEGGGEGANGMDLDDDDEEDSSEEDEDDDEEGEDEEDDSESGSIEDVELGADGSEGESFGEDDDDSEDDEDGDGDDEPKRKVNGFLDVEAEESSGEGDGSDDSE